MKKVLIITYYWPPAGGPGVQRWLKFVKYLPEFGIQPIVYVPSNAHYPLQDKSLLKEISKDIQVIKAPIFEPFYWASKILGKNKLQQMSAGDLPTSTRKVGLLQQLFIWVRGNIFLPDARIFWVLPSIFRLQKIIKKQEIATVITTGPPHSLHLIGLGLQKINSKIRWITDFRDPWTSISYHKHLKMNFFSEWIHQKLEAKVLQSAHQVLVTSAVTKQEFLTKTTQPIHVLTNGFEPLEFSDNFPILDQKFSLVHIGSLYSDRNPENLWKAIGELVATNASFKRNLGIKLIGLVSKDVKQSISINNLDAYTEYCGVVSHKEARIYQLQARVLLLIESDSESKRAIVAGKLFEYLSAKRPILSIVPMGSATAPILRDCGFDAIFNGADSEILKEQLLNDFKKYQNNTLEVSVKNINQYTRYALTKKLAVLLKSQ